MTLHEVVIIDAVRTAIGNHMGALANVPASDLGAELIRTLLGRHAIEKDSVSQVIIGQVLTALCGQNPARQAAMKGGVHESVPAFTINQVCGSGLTSVALAMQSIQTGDSSIVLAGGQESMSLAVHGAMLRKGKKMGALEFQDSMIIDGLWDAFHNYHMGITAENVASHWKISRQMQDEFACESQRKASLAQKNGLFDDEIVPIAIKERKKETIVNRDEFIKPETTQESLAALSPAFNKEGTVTAGNASGINDGAAMLLIMSAAEAKKRGLEPLATIRAWAHHGVPPEHMGIGPVYASRKALDRAGWTIDSLDLIEANEAFAAQALAVNKEMKWDAGRVNVNGGAIALGHPIGASGARVLVTLLHEMKRRSASRGLVTLCVGGGMGVALCVER